MYTAEARFYIDSPEILSEIVSVWHCIAGLNRPWVRREPNAMASAVAQSMSQPSFTLSILFCTCVFASVGCTTYTHSKYS